MEQSADEEMVAPLRVFGGARPPAPRWFEEAITQPFETVPLRVEGAELELLVWGRRGAPGLLLLHGSRAHARWWSPIAARLSDRFHVASLSWSGMGGSDWRDQYSVLGHAREALAAAHAAALFAAGPPAIAAHSYGGGPMLALAQRHGNALAGVIVIDTIIEQQREPMRFPPSPAPRTYETLAQALARFRLAPPQACPNPFYIDWIARHSLRRLAPDDSHAPGYRWAFDPDLWERLEWHDKWASAAQRACPMAMIDADQSLVVGPQRREALRRHMPPGTLFETIRGAGHHVLLDRPLELTALIARTAGDWTSARAGA